MFTSSREKQNCSSCFLGPSSTCVFVSSAQTHKFTQFETMCSQLTLNLELVGLLLEHRMLAHRYIYIRSRSLVLMLFERVFSKAEHRLFAVNVELRTKNYETIQNQIKERSQELL